MSHHRPSCAALGLLFLTAPTFGAELPQGQVWKNLLPRENSVGFSVDVTSGMIRGEYQIVASARLRQPARLDLSVIDEKGDKRLAHEEVRAQKETPGRWVVANCSRLEKPGRYYVIFTTAGTKPARIAHSFGFVTARQDAKAEEDLITEV